MGASTATAAARKPRTSARCTRRARATASASSTTTRRRRRPFDYTGRTSRSSGTRRRCLVSVLLLFFLFVKVAVRSTEICDDVRALGERLARVRIHQIRALRRARQLRQHVPSRAVLPCGVEPVRQIELYSY